MRTATSPASLTSCSPCLLSALVAVALSCASLTAAGQTQLGDGKSSQQAERRQFTFSYQFTPDDAMRPRGGTSRGAPVQLATLPTDEWRVLQEPGLSDFERDRRAILAMAGPYRTSFDFLETVQLTPGAAPQRPYQSWGTEYVYVAEDSGDFISLQHIMVMFVENEDGVVSEPIVMKHWRQDWKYEDRDLHVYAGNDTWRHERISPEEAEGAWTQAVFQVDDAPRYEASGHWVHDGNYSAWTGTDTWRPLPRREHSVRDDYDVLLAMNRHTILPTGWVHEEDNLKLVLDEQGMPAKETPYLARELGLNRYERIEGFDWSAGHEYWQATSAFWKSVRDEWQRLLDEHERLTLAPARDGKSLFEHLFEYAEGVSAADYDPDAAATFIRQTLRDYVASAAP